ncbi:MAG: hypothetical protein MJ099_05220 [Clostridia bacterium]|nr:hypothetical protein [Clostridia bacterium]
MIIELNEAKLAVLKAYLDASEDAEALSATEYVADFFEREVPVSIDLVLDKKGIRIEGAANMKYDDDMDGWYVADRIEDADAILKVLEEAGIWA